MLSNSPKDRETPNTDGARYMPFRYCGKLIICAKLLSCIRCSKMGAGRILTMRFRCVKVSAMPIIATNSAHRQIIRKRNITSRSLLITLMTAKNGMYHSNNASVAWDRLPDELIDVRTDTKIIARKPTAQLAIKLASRTRD